ncbi:MAG: hypothetical protein HY235_11635 [Acidobacteria bacterium]|nr:hypothetical protein [Acidobacteriota bacterium]
MCSPQRWQLIDGIGRASRIVAGLRLLAACFRHSRIGGHGPEPASIIAPPWFPGVLTIIDAGPRVDKVGGTAEAAFRSIAPAPAKVTPGGPRRQGPDESGAINYTVRASAKHGPAAGRTSDSLEGDQTHGNLQWLLV